MSSNQVTTLTLDWNVIFNGMIIIVFMVGMTRMFNKQLLPEHSSGGNMEIERYHGIIVAVGGINTKSLSLPDWFLSYVEFPPGQMREYRGALMKARVRIARVTESRIYFEQV